MKKDKGLPPMMYAESFWMTVYMTLGFLLGLFVALLFFQSADSAPDNDWIENVWDCHDGCVYAEWVQYGYKNLSKSSELYNKCSEACWYGYETIKENTTDTLK